MSDREDKAKWTAIVSRLRQLAADIRREIYSEEVHFEDHRTGSPYPHAYNMNLMPRYGSTSPRTRCKSLADRAESLAPPPAVVLGPGPSVRSFATPSTRLRTAHRHRKDRHQDHNQ